MRPIHMLGFTAALALQIFAANAQRAELPNTDGDLDELIGYAKTITNKSLPACYAAKCTKLDCGATPALFDPLLRATIILNAMDAPMLKLRDKETAAAAGPLRDAGMSQDRADDLRDVQLVADSIAVVYVVASEIASFLDLKRSLGENADEWKKVFNGSNGSAKDWFSLLKDIKSSVARVEAISKYKDIGADKKQTISSKDLAKVSGELALRYAELRRLAESGDLTDAKKIKALLSTIKDIGDLLLKVDKIARQGRIQKYINNAMASFGAAEGLISNIRRYNERRQKSLDALVAIDKAFQGVSVCYLRSCGSAERRGKSYRLDNPDLKPKRSGDVNALRYYNAELERVLDDLKKQVKNYQVIADFTSTLTVDRQTHYTRTVGARFKLKRFRDRDGIFLCIPENSDLRVYRRPYSTKSSPVLELGEAAEIAARKDFKVQQDLSGTWREKNGGLEIRIAANNETMTLTRKDTPVRGRNRVHTGKLKRRLSEPGDYTLLFELFPGQTYLPANFEITGKVPATDDTSKLYAIPHHVDDISPAVPKDIRAKLLNLKGRQAIRYRADITPVIAAGGKVTLKVTLYNHRLRYGKKSRDLVEGSIQEKVWRKVVFERAPTGQAAAKSGSFAPPPR